MAVQKTSLYDTGAHVDVEAEYRAANEDVAIHDSSHTGRVKATGADVLDLLHRISSNDVGSLQPGQGAPTVLITDKGRVLDLVTVLNTCGHILLLTSPQAQDTVIQWIDGYTIVDDIALEDVTSTTAMFSVLGPQAATVLGRAAGLKVEFFQPYQSTQATIVGMECYVVRRDLAGLPRFEVLMSGEHAEAIWQELVGAGAVPLGLEASEVLRVEAGSPAYGRELDEAYNPLETGLWGSISFTKGCYIGQEVVARLDTYQKVQRHLVSLGFSHGTPVRDGVKLALDGREVGNVTSMVRMPPTGRTIGMGYVRNEASEPGTRLSLDGDNEVWAEVEATILPFGPGEGT